MKQLGEQVRRVAATDATVLTSGETGTKKGGEAISQALEALNAYGWPGNVRQLRSAIERASIEAGPEP